MTLPPRMPLGFVYETAEPDMMIRVIRGSKGPGVIALNSSVGQPPAADASLRQDMAVMAEALSKTLQRIAALKALGDRVTAVERFGDRITKTEAFADRIAALEAAGLRTEVITGAGTTIAFAKPFESPPIVIPRPSWNGQQMIIGTATAVTKAGATIAVKRSRGTLLLTAGPFEDAPAGTSFTMIAIGR